MAGGSAARHRAGPPVVRRVAPIIQDLPFTTVATIAAPTTTEFPLGPGAGAEFRFPLDPTEGAPADDAAFISGRIALVYVPHREGPRTLMVLDLGDWSVAFTLTSGQLRRLTNGLAGRGLRNAIRPLSVDGEPVHLTGSPERLVVEYAGRTAAIPAGPKRALSKALRAAEEQPPLT